MVRRNICPISDLGNAFSFSPLRMMLVVGLYMAFIYDHLLWNRLPLYLLSGEFLIINDYLIWSKVFFCIYLDDQMVFSASLLIQSIILIDLHLLKNPLIPRMNPIWSWCVILLMSCWTQFAVILFRIFVSMYISDIDL